MVDTSFNLSSRESDIATWHHKASQDPFLQERIGAVGLPLIYGFSSIHISPKITTTYSYLSRALDRFCQGCLSVFRMLIIVPRLNIQSFRESGWTTVKRWSMMAFSSMSTTQLPRDVGAPRWRKLCGSSNAPPPSHLMVLLNFYYFVNCRYILKMSNTWNKIYGIM